MYFITTVGNDAEHIRCVGYFTTSRKAVKAVKHNWYDLNEAGYYPYAVIEHIAEGIYRYDDNPMWFKFNNFTKEYEASKKPDFIDNHFVGLGLG